MYLSFMSPSSCARARMSRFETLLYPAGLAKDAQPHPETGVSTEIFIFVTHVGRLARHSRERVYKASVLGIDGGFTEAPGIETAMSLKDSLTNLTIGVQSAQHLFGGPSVPHELWELAEAYRKMALLQLYRVCPDMGMADQEAAVLGHSTATTATSRYAALQDIAADITETIQAIPPESKSLQFQLTPPIAAAGELKAGSEPPPIVDDDGVPGDDDIFSPSIKTVQLPLAVRHRFALMNQVFPGGRMSKIISLVCETWKRLDAEAEEDERTYWLDVFIEADWNIA